MSESISDCGEAGRTAVATAVAATSDRSLGLFLVLWLLIGLPAALAAQRPPTIAAAANLNFALTEIAEQFARAQGTRVELVFGASGTLTRQIQDGAPFEMFLAADEEFPNQLVRGGSDARCRCGLRRRAAWWSSRPTALRWRSTSGSRVWVDS